MEEIGRWSPDSDESPSCLPSRPSTPQSVRTLLRSPGSPLRTLGKKLSLTGLSVRSRKTSPGRGEGTRLKESHVGDGGRVASIDNRRRPSYKPLTIAVGRPFQLDVNTALDFVQNSLSPSPGKTSSTDPVKRQLFIPPTMKPRQDDDKTIRPARSFMMSSSNLSRRLEATATSPPPMRTIPEPSPMPRQRVITGDFRDLSRMPPPDLSQHPANQADPHSSVSDAPLMVTTSKKEEIKALVKEARRRFDEKERQMEREEAEQEEAERQGTVRFKSLPKRGNAFAAYSTGTQSVADLRPAGKVSMERTNTPKASVTFDLPQPSGRPAYRQSSDPVHGSGLRNKFSGLQLDKDNEEADIYDILNEGSHMATTTPQHRKTSVGSGSLSGTPASDRIEQKKSGLRKVSGMFNKPKLDKSPAEVTSPKEPNMLHRPDLERYIRTTSNNHSYDYDIGQPYPRHPNTSRAWHSRNLKCTTCLDECCVVCGRACCAYKAASLAIKNHKDNPDSLKVAEERLVQITFLFPYGQEAPTFLQCTKGGEVGCGKMVCPDCCGECPDPICKDIQCRKCKKEPWDECWWHAGDMSQRGV